MKRKLCISLICCILVVGLATGCGKKEINTITFDEDLIISNLTIKDIKLSELNSINDILTKVKGSKKSGVTVCYKNVDQCKYYPNNEFYDNKKDKNISTIDIRIEINDESVINYSIFYNDYKNNIDNAPYFQLEFVNVNNLIKLDNTPVENYTKDELNNKFKITKTAFSDAQYIYEFKNNKNDSISLSGYFGNSNITIYNHTERDRGVK